MKLFSPETFRAAEIHEKGPFFSQEVTENGLMVFSIEKAGDYESFAALNRLNEHPDPAEAFGDGVGALKESLAASGGEFSPEVRASIMNLSRCMNAPVRGVHVSDRNFHDPPMDGIIYLPSAPGTGKNTDTLAESIIAQIDRYT